ncbi:aquarius intron-binding spliceosomal factor, partial [Homo sapiens]
MPTGLHACVVPSDILCPPVPSRALLRNRLSLNDLSSSSTMARIWDLLFILFTLQLACKYWAPHIKKKSPFDIKVIEDIYEKEIVKSRFAIRKIMLLEFSQYLENYLWMNYSPEVSSKAYLMSICCMVNEKFRENVPAWEIFKKKPDHFPFFFKHILKAALAETDGEFSLHEQTVLLLFLD